MNPLRQKPVIADYPYGMLLPGRHASVDADPYRFKFNGMEADDEIKGDGNSYDFGARMYDPRLMRWFAPDPLERKYAHLSPYVYAGNSPIIYVDYDGRDFGIRVNHETKTITIVANIYTIKEDQADVQKAVSKWEEMDGKYFYKTKDENGADMYYEVKVDINVKVAKEFEHDGDKFSVTGNDLTYNSKSPEGQVRLNANNDPIGNSFIYVSESNSVFTEDPNRSAVTENSKNVKAKESDRGNATLDIIHEIGHLLNNGSGHYDQTYMAKSHTVKDIDTGETIKGEGRKETFSIAIFKGLLKTAGIGSRKRHKNRIRKGKKREIVTDLGGLSELNLDGKLIECEDVPDDKK